MPPTLDSLRTLPDSGLTDEHQPNASVLPMLRLLFSNNQSMPKIQMRRSLFLTSFIALFFSHAVMGQNNSLVVYPNIPGAVPSEHFAIAVRATRGDTSWRRAFASQTQCKPGIDGKNGYFPRLSDWSNTFVNFETDGPVEVAIARTNGKPIVKAMAHPQRKVESCVVRDGRAYITIDKPCLFAVDIDGQMDDQNTGMGYEGPPIHTVTLFANPILQDRPLPTDPDVFAVSPGQQAPTEGDWKTLYFMPGIHEIGIRFRVHANKNYYIPGDAVVHGTISNHGDWSDGHDIRIFGYGCLSGARIAHPKYASPRPEEDSFHNPIDIVGPANTSVEGITLIDPAHHSLMLTMGYEPEKPTDIRWVKILAWRVNGDGINPFGNGLIEDCFIRTQDDSLYVNGRGIRRVTCWNDWNGSSFVLSAMPNRPLIVEDCDVIYARAGWHHWGGGRVFNMRGEGGGDCGQGVVFRNIRVEDTRPTLQTFMVAMEGFEPYLNPNDRQRESGNLSGVLFQNIEIAASSVLGEPDVLWGSAEANIVDLTFDNLTIGDKKIQTIDHFKHNQYVEALEFK